MPTVMPDITPGTASTPTRLRLCLYGSVDTLPSGKCVKSHVDSVLANGCMLWLASWHRSIRRTRVACRWKTGAEPTVRRGGNNAPPHWSARYADDSEGFSYPAVTRRGGSSTLPRLPASGGGVQGLTGVATVRSSSWAPMPGAAVEVGEGSGSEPYRPERFISSSTLPITNALPHLTGREQWVEVRRPPRNRHVQPAHRSLWSGRTAEGCLPT